MSILVPVYYSRFRCAASACRHTCCAGWEIDIDGDTAAFYRALPGPFGEELRGAMAAGEEGASFRLTAEGKCPFLDGEGLCRVYRTLGEAHLCQICRDHPRFRNDFSAWTEVGLGLCCEEAARVILTETRRAVLVPLAGPAPVLPSDGEEGAFLAFRRRALDLLWDRSRPPEERFCRLEEAGMSVPGVRPRDLREEFLALERLEDSWTELLEARLRAPRQPGPRWDLPLEQAAVCFLFRHLPGALEDGLYRERCALAVLLCRLLSALFAREEAPSMEGLADLARCLSCEIEYSDQNIPRLLEALC